MGKTLAQAVVHANPSQGAHVLAEEEAEVGFEQEVDERVIKGGGFGKNCRDGEGHGRDVLKMAKCRPHRHKCIWTPCSEESYTHRHTQLEKDRERA